MHLANGPFALPLLLICLALTALTALSVFRKRLIIRSLLSQGQMGRLLSGRDPVLSAARTAALAACLYLAAFSALDPRWGTKSSVNPVEGIDVVFVMDISRSMLASHPGPGSPDRLTAARKYASHLMGLLDGNRIGMTAFAGFAFNVIPLTTDTAAASLFLNELSTDMIDVQGSNLEDALRKALELFEKEALTHRAVVMFTDGEDTEFEPMSQARIARERGVPVFTVWLGGPDGGWIPLTGADGRTADYLKKNGQIVTSRPNPELLRRISAETGGHSFRAEEASVLEIARRLDSIRKTRFGSNVYEYMEPQYQYFLLLAVICLVLSLFLPERGFRKKLLGSVLAAGALIGAGIPGPLHASEASRGVGEYRRGKYENALESFRKAAVRDPKNEKLKFNEGASLFRLRRPEESAAAFSGLTNSRDRAVREKSLYNFGVASHETGRREDASDAYRRLLQSLSPESPLYEKTVRNLLYLKKTEPPRDGGGGDDGEGPQDRQQTNRGKAKEIAPTDVDQILSLIEEEEKKNLRRKERAPGQRSYPKNDW